MLYVRISGGVRVAAGVLAVAGVLAAGCTTTVAGHPAAPSIAATSNAPQTSPQTSEPPSGPAPSSGSPAQSTNPSTIPTSSSPAGSTSSSRALPTTTLRPSKTTTRTALRCPAAAVTVTDAPFCYPLPAGFTNAPSLLATTGADTQWTFRTLVALNPASQVDDLIRVYAARSIADTDTLDDKGLQQLYVQQKQRYTTGVGGVAHAGTPTAAVIDGARGFAQTVRYPQGITILVYTVFRGNTLLSIDCNMERQTAKVTAACVAIRRSIQLISL